LLETKSLLFKVCTPEFDQISIFSLKILIEFLTIEKTFSSELLNPEIVVSCSSAKIETPSTPFCNFLALTFKTEANFGKKVFKKN
jgi:hypothetical protein